MEWQDAFRKHVRSLGDWWVDRTDRSEVILDDSVRIAMARKRQLMRDKKAQIEKAMLHAEVTRCEEKREDLVLSYQLHTQWLIKQKGELYLEEGIEKRQAVLRGDRIVSDRMSPAPVDPGPPPGTLSNDDEPDFRRGPYNRLEAVRYAELWWNRRNPDFPRVENDCTNFISQCLFAGGIQMWGSPVRSRGWWHDRTNWSFSWAVANSLRWYLSRGGNLMSATEKDSPDQLIPGDVICYDFEGDGHWNHNTIVTALDPSGMPLVNAHTYDARARDWSYVDSPAWTKRIQYKFFHIKG